MKERIYEVTPPDVGGEVGPSRLVRAASATQAIKHVTKGILAEVPSMERYGVLLLSGVKVEEVERE